MSNRAAKRKTPSSRRPPGHPGRRPPCRKLASGGISSSRTRCQASSRCKSLNAPGLRPGVRRDRVGPLFHRWYQPGVGRYSRVDPAGLIEGDPNPYLYASGRPIVFIDEFGLATFKNFPADKQRQVERALEQARKKLEDMPCCVGSPELAEELLDKLNDPDLVIIYKPRLKYCGQTPVLANVFGRRRFHLGPLAFDPVRCCDLASTIVHEAFHIGAGGSESDAQQIEKDCFDCPRGRASGTKD